MGSSTKAVNKRPGCGCLDKSGNRPAPVPCYYSGPTGSVGPTGPTGDFGRGSYLVPVVNQVNPANRFGLQYAGYGSNHGSGRVAAHQSNQSVGPVGPTSSTTPVAAADICNADSLVYRAAAASYRNLADTNLTVDQVTFLLEGPQGYLAQYSAASKLTGCCRENGQVFANAIVAAIDAAAEFGNVTGSSVVTVLQAFAGTGASADPAVLGFYVIQILLNQYYSYLQANPASVKDTAEVFGQAFRDIFSNLITTYGVVRSVDITYVSAVAHYLNLELGISPALPIIVFSVVTDPVDPVDPQPDSDNESDQASDQEDNQDSNSAGQS